MEAEEEEIDTLHRQIYQLVVNDVPKAVATYLDMIRERRKLLEEVSKVIEPINVKKFTAEQLSDRRITGADGRANARAMRAWFKCLEINRLNGQFKEFIDGLREAIPKDDVGIDIKIPEETQIVSDFKRIKVDPLPY